MACVGEDDTIKCLPTGNRATRRAVRNSNSRTLVIRHDSMITVAGMISTVALPYCEILNFSNVSR